MPAKTRIWFDGRIVDYEAATTHVLSHSLHYGLGAFEGIRAYETATGPAVFRLTEHIDRLFDSCRIALIEVPFTRDQIVRATFDVIRDNRLSDCYVRPLVWLGEGSIKVAPSDNVIHVAVAAWPWGAYLGEEALAKGVRCCVSSYTRMGIRSHHEKAKISGQYTNSVLAKREALLNGYDEAIMLDTQGYVTEGTGENLFIVRDQTIETPQRGSSILAGLTRDTIMVLGRELGYEVHETTLTRSDLLMADEVFLTGTAAEVTPVREIDNRTIGRGTRGPITEALQSTYFSLVRGERDGHERWLEHVPPV